MMKTLARLVAATKSMAVGNHAVTVYKQGANTSYYVGGHKWGTWGNIIAYAPTRRMEGVTRYFMYHGNKICLVDDVQRRVTLSHGGWNTPSTSRTLNDYRAHFTAAGYQVIEEV